MKKYVLLILLVVSIIFLPNLVNAEDESNTNLKIMRTNKENIVPNFDKGIFEYYLTVDNNTNSLDLTAVPENENSKVEIIGNKNFKQGSNVVEIKVISPNGNSNSYKIYVTKTNDIEKANTNLETLAIENVLLYPYFDTTMTKYNVSVDNDVEKLNILAVPENVNAKVSIEGNDVLNVGDNTIIVNVLAEDGVAFRKYEIIAHRRNTNEQEEFEEHEEEEAEQLEVLMSEYSEENQNIEENEINNDESDDKNDDKLVLLFIIIGLIIVFAFAVVYFKKNKIINKK